MKHQRGATAVSILFVILVAIIFVRAGMALVPMYMDDKIVGTILDNMYDSQEVRSETNPNRLKQQLEQRLQSNNVQVSTKGVQIRAVRTGLELDWQYEQRANWIGNVDLVMTFHRQKDFSK